MNVSILTPSYQQASFLPDCLESIQRQRYGDIEHVVQDGGSTDGTVELLQAQASATTTWVSAPDEGQSDALVTAFTRSTGDIVGWINSDDALADVRTVEWVVGAFRSHPHVGVVYGHVLDTDALNRVVRLTHSPRAWVRHLHRDINPIKQPGAFFRREILERHGFVDVARHYTMDHELFIRLLNAGVAALRIDRYLAVNRHQLERKSFQRPTEYIDEYREYAGATSTQEWRRRMSSALVHLPARALGAAEIPSVVRNLKPACASLAFPPTRQLLAAQLFRRTEAFLLEQGP